MAFGPEASTLIWKSVSDIIFLPWHFIVIYLSSFTPGLFLVPPPHLVLPWMFSPTYCFLLPWLQSQMLLRGQLLVLSHCCCCLHGYRVPVLGFCLICTCFAASLSAASAAYPTNYLALPLLNHLTSAASSPHPYSTPMAAMAQGAICLAAAVSILLLLLSLLILSS